MTRNLLLLLSAGGLALMGLNASAAAYRDLDVLNPVNPLNGLLLNGSDAPRTTIGGNFNIAAGDGGALDISGYNPLTETIISASVIFRFRDDIPGLDTGPDGTEFVTIDLGGAFFLGPTEVTTVLTAVGGPVLGSALINLDADGILSYTIHWISGDFFAVSANLDAVSGRRAPAPVPDGGTTLGLLGLACLALGCAGRKLKAI